MLKVKVNGDTELEVDPRTASPTVNGKTVSANWIRTGQSRYHMIAGDRSFTVEIEKTDERNALVIVNGVKHEVSVTTELDALLHNLGMDKVASGKVNTVKAPMPGLVLRIIAEEGSPVTKGDPLLVLEAMKMENVIKAAADGMVKKVLVTTRMAVEKNQVLLELE
jgi:biotin carboxyl carrier protein